MKRFFQIMLGLVFTVVGFFGCWLAFLRWRNMSYWWALLLALALLATAVWLNAQLPNSRWLSVMAIGYGFGAALITLAFSYGSAEHTWGFIILTAFVAGTTVTFARNKRPKTILRIWVSAFVISIIALSADHLILHGRLFAWKWRVIEHPVFTPFEIQSAERHGRKAIYLFDMNGPDSSAVALIWGWSLFPKFAFPENSRQKGILFEDKAIQEMIR